MFATAPSDVLSLCDFDFPRFEAGPLMGTITKGLCLRASARAPPVGAGLDFLHEGFSLAYDDGFAHGPTLRNSKERVNTCVDLTTWNSRSSYPADVKRLSSNSSPFELALAYAVTSRGRTASSAAT